MRKLNQGVNISSGMETGNEEIKPGGEHQFWNGHWECSHKGWVGTCSSQVLYNVTL